MIYHSFNSIDRLIEFGMGLAVARQMVDTMNYTMNEMNFAGQNSSLGQIQSAIQYFIVIDNQQIGPLSESELEQLVKNHTLTPDTFVWYNSLPGWQFAKDIPSIAKLLLLNK